MYTLRHNNQDIVEYIYANQQIVGWMVSNLIPYKDKDIS